VPFPKSRENGNLLLTISLEDFLRPLAPTEWARETALTPWHVADIVAHLLVVGKAYFESALQGVQGSHQTPTTRQAGVRGPRPLQEILDFRDEMVAEAAGQRATLGTPEALLGRFTQTFGQLAEFMESLSTSDWNKPTSLSFGGEMAVHRLVRIAISELALHSWDIRVAFAPHAELSLPSQRVLSTNALARLFRVVDTSDFPLVSPESVRYRFRVVGQVERVDDVVVAEGTARMEPATSNAAHVEYRMNASDFILVFYKRLRLGPLTTAGRVRIEGDAQLVRFFDEWLDTKELP
jgi:hypothetical protein